jgi:Tfp pilus assembly protein PilW
MWATRERGVTVVELMIGMALSLVITGRSRRCW